MNFKNYETLSLQMQGQTLMVSVDRPKALNALSEIVLSELRDLLMTIKENNNSFHLRGMILTGAGEKAFIAGADIKGMNEMSPEQGESFGGLGQQVTLLLEEINIPVVAAVNGFALGGGCEIAMSCDFIYATESAVFGQPEVNLGLIPGFGGCVRLPRYVGLAMARELIYSGRNVKAKEAQKIGLVQKVFKDKQELLKGAQQIIELIANRSPVAVATCKSTIMKAEPLSIAEGLGVEKASFREVFSSQDKMEGVKAFVEKRKAQFPGK